ncbi:MAG: NAD-dependent epimerase/dehydratase family protein [Planctomycetota bacterium]
MSEPARLPPSVLIAGCGYAGQRAARYWRQCGARVSAITRSPNRGAEFAAAGIEPIVLDLTDPQPWPPLPDAELILWSVGYDRASGHSREAVWLSGFKGFLNSLPATANPRRFLLTSSTSVYRDRAGGDVDEDSFADPEPGQEGGRVCLQAEGLLKEFSHDHNITPVILRLAGIYGPGRLLRRLEDLRNEVPIVADPDSWLNLVHVDDITTALDFCARHPQPPCILNVAAAETATRRQYYQTLAELAGCPAPLFAPAPGGGSGRTGNRRVVSIERPRLGLKFQYEDCRSGLLQALKATPRQTP